MVFDSDCDCDPDADTDTDRHSVVLKNPFLFGKDFQVSSTADYSLPEVPALVAAGHPTSDQGLGSRSPV